MTSQLLTRVPTELKNQFKAKAERNGFSMDYLVNVFIRTYTENPNIVQTYIDEVAFDRMLDQAWKTSTLAPSFDSLDNTLKSKWLL